jgi:hypothetical protein
MACFSGPLLKYVEVDQAIAMDAPFSRHPLLSLGEYFESLEVAPGSDVDVQALAVTVSPASEGGTGVYLVNGAPQSLRTMPLLACDSGVLATMKRPWEHGWGSVYALVQRCQDTGRDQAMGEPCHTNSSLR